MYDKLSIINTCLGLTGNNLVAVADDGSDEWNTASLAYEEAVKYLLGGHDWKFGTQIVTLNREGDSEDPAYEDAFAKPANCLGLVWVKSGGIPLEWRILGNKIVASAGDTVEAKIVLQPGPEEFSPLFAQALSAYVRAGCYSGLNEEPDEARQWRQEGEAILSLARTRSDREQAPRRVYRSRLLARRRGLVGQRLS